MRYCGRRSKRDLLGSITDLLGSKRDLLNTGIPWYEVLRKKEQRGSTWVSEVGALDVMRACRTRTLKMLIKKHL
jgi:hypothetical protein